MSVLGMGRGYSVRALTERLGFDAMVLMRVDVMVGVLAIVFASTSACLSSRTGEIETARQSEINQAGQQEVSKLVSPSCDNDQQSNDPPSQHWIRYGDSNLLQ